MDLFAFNLQFIEKYVADQFGYEEAEEILYLRDHPGHLQASDHCRLPRVLGF